MADTVSLSDDALSALMQEMGDRARTAAKALSLSTADQRTAALRAMADALDAAEAELLRANEKDLETGRQKQITKAMVGSPGTELEFAL